MRIVLFIDNEAYLLLDEVVFKPGGHLKGGYVVNGDWKFEIRGGISLALAGREVVNSWQCLVPYEYITIPPDIIGDYNYVMEWASKQDRSHRCLV